MTHDTAIDAAPRTTGSTAEALQRAGRLEDAAHAYRQTLAETPGCARTLGNYGGLLNGLCRFDEAEQALLQAVSLDPGAAGAWANLGNTMTELQRFDDAIAAFSNCLRLDPSNALALANLGVALTARGLPQQAITLLDLALALDPDNPETRCNRSLALLAAGDYARGFAEYESRWQTPGKPPHGHRVPEWDGGRFDGLTLLIHGEGGFGDVVQFARYVALAKARGGRVVLHVRAPLVRLLSHLPGADDVLPQEQPPPAYDLHCPMFSLPHRFNTTLETIPAADGYLPTEPSLVEAWQARLRSDASCLPGGNELLRIGLVWAGGPHPYHREAALADRRRSVGLAALAPLAEAAPDALFYSLQKGTAATAVAPTGMRLIDHTHHIVDFADTAALVSLLDLVISVDTSTAHVAGALGRPVWMLSRYDQCWRWLTGRRDTPWYGSMRLYQQPAPFDWHAPIAAVAADLAALVSRGRSRQA